MRLKNNPTTMKVTAYLSMIMTFLLIVMFQPGFAQDKVLTGKVASANGAGIQGVTIQEKGARNFTTSDAEGHYSIRLSKPGSVLVFSFVGFTPREVPAGDGASLDVTLTENDKQLNEVVVTALGIRKEVKRIGYSTQEVKGSELTKAREPNAINGLTGKVAGLTIGSSAEMLGRPTVVLRGSTDLLFVVDGVPVSSDTWNISADDIETYTILKGPNAAALYGFRGQNGAIVITTKKGSKDKKGWTVEFNSSEMLEKGFTAVPKPQAEYGIGGLSAPFLYSYAAGYNYSNLYGTDVLYDNAQRASMWGPRFEGQAIRQFDSPYDPLTNKRSATPWTARGANNLSNFIQAGLLSTNNISASTSGENYDVRMSYSHTYQKGIDPNTKLNIDNLNINTSVKLSDKFTAEANLNLGLQYTPNIPDASYGPNSYVYELSVYGSTDYDVRDLKNYYKGPQGVPGLMQYNNEYGRANNPYFQAAKWLHGHNKTDIYGFAKLTYKINDNMNLSFRSQITTWNQLRSEKVPASTILNGYLPAGWYTFGSYNGDYREDSRRLIENNTDLLLTYNKKLSHNWDLSALAGASMRSYKYVSSYITTQNLSLPSLYTFSNSKGTVYSYNYIGNMMVWSGYYTLDLSYKNYFTISNTGRVDNLSTLAKGNNTFFYPSVSVSSAISDYVKLPDFISFMKVRASFADVKGALTSSTIPSAFQAINGKSVNSGLLGYGTELYSAYDGPSYTNQNVYSTTTYYNNTPSVNYSNTLANSTLKPYDNKSYEGGIDLKFMKNRLGLSATYFTSINGPQIYALGVAPSSGYSAQNVNGITSERKGLELSLQGSVLKSAHGLNWDVLVNWSTYKETLKKIYGTETGWTINNHTYHVGERLDAYYGTGFVRDPNHNIIYSGGAPLKNPNTDVNSQTFLGYMNPSFAFGINNRFSYKNFSFSFQFDGRIGGKIFDRILYQMNNAGTSQESVSGDLGAARLKEWKSTNGMTVSPTAAYVGKGKVITSGTPTYTNGVINNAKDLQFADNTQAVLVQSYLSSGIGSSFNEYYMISRSYAKLREVTIAYSLPAGMLGKSGFKSATVSLVGRNLLYFAKRKDFDIDQYSSGYNFSSNSLGGTSGTDLQSPTARRYGININLVF